MDWLRINCLQCNPDKTEFLLFGYDPLPGWTGAWPSSDILPPTPMLFDVQLSFKAQIPAVVKSCSWILRMLKIFLDFLPWDAQITVVRALILSRLDYANVLYLEIPDYLIHLLQVVQNMAIRPSI